MFLKRLLSRLLFAVVVVHGSLAQSSPSSPLYLSFEQRLLASLVLAYESAPELEKQVWAQKIEELKGNWLKSPRQEVVVQNFEEFLDKWKGPWPNTQSLNLDLELLKNSSPSLRTFKSPSSRVQKQIEAYQEREAQFLFEKAKVPLTNFLAGEKLLQYPNPMATPARSANGIEPFSAERIAILSGLQATESFVQAALGQFGEIGQRISDFGFAQQEASGSKLALQTLIGEYYARLSSDSKKQILSAFLGAPLELNEMQRFEIMVQNSGPQLQKLLQVISRQGNIPIELVDVFKTLENAVKPVPWSLVEQLLIREKDNFNFIYFERKPLGVGTMAQVHRAKIIEDGQKKDVVVRFIKPDIKYRINEDHRILKEVAQLLDSNKEYLESGSPKITPIIEDLTETVRAELNLQETIDRQLKGALAYNKDMFLVTPEFKNELKVHVPHVYAGKNKNSQLMVQEMVIGRKLDKEANAWKDVAPNLKKAVVESVATLWTEELMFKGGFYHSDLHQGNFMIKLTDEAVKLFILDFGMGGVISADMQKHLFKLGIGMELVKGEMIADAFWALSEKTKNQVSLVDFKKQVMAAAADLKTENVKWGIAKWSAMVMDAGLRLPYEFISINRGQVILDKLLEESGSDKRVQSLAKDLAKKHPVKMSKFLLKDSGLSWKEIAELGYSQLVKDSSRRVDLFDEAKKLDGLITHRCEALF